MSFISSGAPSPDARLKPSDSDGNVLTVLPLQIATGEGVLSVASGDIIARLLPGSSYSSPWIELPIPSIAESPLTIGLEVDKFHLERFASTTSFRLRLHRCAFPLQPLRPVSFVALILRNPCTLSTKGSHPLLKRRLNFYEEEGVTDTQGELILDGLTPGSYLVRASAPDHGDELTRIRVLPGITTSEELFLKNRVTEIAIEDRYEITLDLTYETDVPVAVLVMEPVATQLPNLKKGEVFYGELTLTNYGLRTSRLISQQVTTKLAMSLAAKFQLR